MGPTIDIIIVVAVLGGLAALVVWGYVGWARNSPRFSGDSAWSLAGFTLASLSASLEIGAGIYAQFTGRVSFLDPALLTIYRVGFFMAGFGFVASLIGLVRKNALRWKAPVLSAVMLLLWFWHAVSE